MTDYKKFGFSKKELQKHSSLQKKTFFLKTESCFTPKIFLANKKKVIKNRTVKSIIDLYFGKQQASVFAIKNGTLHVLYRIVINDKAYILRINKFSKNYKEFSFFTEQWIYEVLHANKLSSLNVIAVDISRKIFPFDFQIIEEVPGVSLFELGRERKIAYKQHYNLGIYIASVHKNKTSGFGPFSIDDIFLEKGIGIHNSWKDFVFLNLEAHIGYCIKHKLLDNTSAQKIETYFSHLDKRLFYVDPVLLHGDIANHNVFVKGNKISGVIDWEDSISGDPVYDIAYFGTGCYRNEQWLSAFLDGYKIVKSLPKDFEKKYWFYYLRIAIAKSIIRHATNKKNRNFGKRIEYGLEKLESLV